MSNIETLRQQINEIDHEIIKKLYDRFEVAKEIGRLKKEIGQNILDSDRESELLDMYKSWAQEFNLDPDFIKLVFEKVLKQSKKIQEKL